MALSRLVTISISSLRNLDIEANKFYDRAHRLYDAALLTRCYTQHGLRPYIDSERTSDGGNGNHSLPLPIILIKIKVDHMLPSSYISSLLVPIL